MAYDQALAERVRDVLVAEQPTERKMFGGLCFMVGGHMCAGLVGETLMLRLGEEGADAALDEPHTRPMDFTGKPMRTMIYVDPPAIAADSDLEKWLGRAVTFARSLPPK